MTQASPTADIIEFPQPSAAADTTALEVLREMVRGYRRDADEAHRYALMRSMALEASIEAEMERLGWRRSAPKNVLKSGDRVSYEYQGTVAFGIIVRLDLTSGQAAEAYLILERGGYDMVPLEMLAAAPFDSPAA